jgi:hypothetical protein
MPSLANTVVKAMKKAKIVSTVFFILLEFKIDFKSTEFYSFLSLENDQKLVSI